VLGHDVAALVHTAAKPGLQPVALDGMHCLYSMARPLDSSFGGVACLIQPWLKEHARVVRKRPDMGIMWIKFAGINPRLLFVAICYLPPATSGYYKEPGMPDRAGHFAALQSDVSEFSGNGDVVVLGDLNSRTGTAPDCFDDDVGWQGLAAAGVAIPPGAAERAATLRALPPRRNADAAAPNVMGRALLQLCCASQLAIINGRMPGDPTGARTFVADGQQGTSLVDYVIASPSLFFTDAGDCKAACDLQVGSEASLVLAPGGGRFDHLPVTAQFTVQPVAVQPSVPQGRPLRSYPWEPTAQALYVDLLRHEEHARNCFHNAAHALDASTAANCLTHGIEHVIHLLSQHGYKVIKSARTALNTAPCNSWYDDACRAARQKLRDAQHAHGLHGDLTREAGREYKRAISKAKAVALRARADSLQQMWYSQPRRFWGAFKRANESAQSTDIAGWTAYFAELLAGAGQGSYYGGSLGEHCTHYADCFPVPPAAAAQAAAALNADITEAEVAAVLRAIAGGKAPGMDGIVAEYFKCATRTVSVDGVVCTEYVLAPVMTAVFNAVLRGEYPEAWSVGALCPVPKSKGDPTVFDNNRGIAVGPALGKMYSMVMMQRMDDWAEEQQLRAAGQAGFRKERATTDNVFVLQHMIERYKVARKPLFCAFIDFRKAYDCVDRGLLWRCLSSYGLHGDALSTLMQMYSAAKMQVRLHGRAGEAFDTQCGVKQGDPLSPLLFGLFIDRLEQYMRARLPGVGCKVDAQTLLQLLLYADDVVLFAESASELQDMLDCLHDFCKANLLSVNVGKSEVVVFNSSFAGASRAAELQYAWSIDGAALTRSDKFVYLGVMFEDESHMRMGAKRSTDKGRAALFALIRRCHEMGLHNVAVKCHLFNSLVVPVMSYGCEVWGAYHFAKIAMPQYMWGSRGLAEQVQWLFLRQSLGVFNTTAVAPMMHETGRQPIMHFWVSQLVNFWNKVMSRPEHDLVRIAMLDSVHMAEAGRQCWAKAFLDGVCAVDHNFHAAITTAGSDRCLVPSRVMQCVETKWRGSIWRPLHSIRSNVATANVRNCPDNVRDGFKLLTYQCWFRHADQLVPKGEGFVYHVQNKHHIAAMARFRLGSSWLNIDRLRYGAGKRVRSARVCPCCQRFNLQAREDEMHVLECPTYAGLRAQYHDVVSTIYTSSDNAMYMMMNKNNDSRAWRRLAEFMFKTQLERRRVLDPDYDSSSDEDA
jgi:hypothetical protein